MQTYNGHVRTPTDAIILFEACRIGLLPRVQRRLSEKERQSIKSGSVFVWDEREAGMRRWTDGKSWSASRVSGSFLTYREMEGKRGGSGFDKAANRDGMSNPDGDSDGGPDGYRYKPDGLMKQSFSITTNNNQHLHLISYFSRSSTNSPNLMQPSNDPQLRHIRPEKGMYPESTVHEQSAIPAVTRGPMHSPSYVQPSHQQQPYSRGPPPQYYPPPQWAPPSPMHTPPPHHPHHQSSQQHQPYYQQPPYVSGPPPPHHQHPSHSYGSPSHPHPYDRAPPPSAHGPAHHGHHYSQGPPPPATGGHAQNYPPPASSYHSSYTSHRPTSPHYSHPYSYDKRSSADRARLDALEKPRSEPHPEAKHTAPPPHRPEPAASTAQTIPSISAMLNNSDDRHPAMRPSSRSPGGTMRTLQDIPSHKLGFEVNRDVHTLRTLDKTTFKGY